MSLNELLADKTIVLSHDATVFSRLSALKSSTSPVLVAISGESAAGKTTFLNALGGLFKKASFIDADHYFNDISVEIQQKGGFSNLVNAGYESDAPTSFQLDCLRQDLSRLKEGHSIKIPFYDMKTGASIKEAQDIHLAPLIFVAGICTLYETVHDLFDLKMYLQADPLEQRDRYFSRAKERGQTNPYEVYHQFIRVSQMAEKYIVPTKQHADIIVKGRLPRPVLKKSFVNIIKELTRE